MATNAKTAPHMKAILFGFHDYATEHNEFFPPAYFPDAGSADQLGESSSSGEARWLDSTIFAQVYPDRSASVDGTRSDATDNTTRSYSGEGDGAHLLQTVFLVESALHLYASEEELNYYDMSFCLNRSLITDTSQAASKNAEFTPRKRSLFADDAATMLIIEGSEGEKNSISFNDRDQIEEGAARYDGRFVHVGFMDGHVERLKLHEIPESPTENDEDQDSFFWTGTDLLSLRAYVGGGGSDSRAMDAYMPR